MKELDEDLPGDRIGHCSLLVMLEISAHTWELAVVQDLD